MVNTGARGLGGGENVLPQLVRTRKGLFVGSDDTDTSAQGKRIQLGDILGASVVDQNGLGGGGSEVFDDLGQAQGGLGGGGKGVDDVVQADCRVVFVVKRLAGGGNVGEGQLGRGLASREGLELVDEAFADATGT